VSPLWIEVVQASQVQVVEYNIFAPYISLSPLALEPEEVRGFGDVQQPFDVNVLCSAIVVVSHAPHSYRMLF